MYRPTSRWAAKVCRSLKQNQSQRVARLEVSGKLEAMIDGQGEQATQEFVSLHAWGMQTLQAHNLVLCGYLLLPDETHGAD